MRSEILKENWKQTDISKEEVIKVLEISNDLLIKAQSDDTKADYLGAHKANREFRRINNLNKKQIYEIASKTKVHDFCHYEKDSRNLNERLYCFKLSLALSSDVLEDVLYKFKLRKKEDGSQTFVMSFHYPDLDKDPWIHLWKKR